MAQLVALLRGINLGRNKRIAMAELRDMLEGLGYDDVRTLLQSGNALFHTTDKPAVVERAVERAIADRFGFDVPVMVRTGAQLRDVVATSPFDAIADDPKRYQVVFLSKAPDAAAVRALTDADHGAEQFAAKGREFYCWCPEGVQNSVLLKAIDKSKTGADATVRNWNTVTKLHSMLAD